MNQKRYSGVLPPWLAAGLAAGSGLAVSFRGLWWTWPKETVHPSVAAAAAPNPPIDLVTLMAAPVLIVAVVAASAYMLFLRRDAVRERVAEGSAKIAAQLTAIVQRLVAPKAPSGARAIFYAIVGGSAVIGGLLALLLYSFGADGSPPGGTGDTAGTTLAGAMQGAVLGLAFGFVLAAPTAIIVWFLGRGRR